MSLAAEKTRPLASVAPPAAPTNTTTTVALDAIPGAHQWFADSKYPELRSKSLSLQELVAMASEVSGIPIDVLAREGLVLRAKAAIQSWHVQQADATAQRAGQADDRLAKAYQALVDQNIPVTPARLATQATTNYHTAKRWLFRTHPQLADPNRPQTTTGA